MVFVFIVVFLSNQSERMKKEKMKKTKDARHGSFFSRLASLVSHPAALEKPM